MFDGEGHTFHPVNRDILLIQSSQEKLDGDETEGTLRNLEWRVTKMQ